MPLAFVPFTEVGTFHPFHFSDQPKRSAAFCMASGETPGETDPYIESLGEDSYSIHGNVSLRDLEDATGVTLEEDCDTFTGLAFNLLGNVPEDGPQDILLEHPKMSIHISLVEDHQVEEATVKIKPAPAAEE